jgi:ribosomal protein S18 acetylase RimI-like enzyme
LSLSSRGQIELLRALMEHQTPLRTRVRGFSMGPFIRDGDVVTIVPVTCRQPGVGDVVACVPPETERLVVHRLVAREDTGWVLRGDNSLESDGVVGGDSILGTVTRVERNGREIAFGEGHRGAVIAWLSRAGKLRALGRPRRLLYRAASSILEHVQGLATYRRLGRKLASPVDIHESTLADSPWAGRHCHGAARKHSDCAAAEPPARDVPGLQVAEWTARRRGKIIGSVQLVEIGDQLSPWVGHWLFSLSVKGRCRALGVGQALTRRVVERARALGAESLSLAVFEDNERAIQLYRGLGFAPVTIAVLEPLFEEEREIYGHRRVVMSRSLLDRL